eukprot:7552329-Ditylum_brightwellii.AAC.1
MEKVLFQQHVIHFKQAHPTLIAQPYLANMFGSYIDMEFSENYQEGKADIDSLETDIHTKEVLQEVQRKQSNPS